MGVLTEVIGQFLLARSVWGVELANGKLLSERTIIRDPLTGKRPFDWTLDLVATGDIRLVKRLFLSCPPTEDFPRGQVVQLPIIEPYTAFQFKVAHLHGIENVNQVASQVIGRVIDKESGQCECLVWDVGIRKLGMFSTSVYDFQSWRQDIAPLGPLSLAVLGLRLS